jgi:hypothetical protein
MVKGTPGRQCRTAGGELELDIPDSRDPAAIADLELSREVGTSMLRPC